MEEMLMLRSFESTFAMGEVKDFSAADWFQKHDWDKTAIG